MYTVHQLAELAGISVRTLHYYDEIGLLKPGSVQKNGYREYGESELLRLQQILFFRELDLPLEDISKIINAPDFMIVDALRDHKKLIKLKQKHLEALLNTIDKTIKRMNKQNIKDEELYDAFKDNDVKQYQDEVKQRWGNTEAYKQSMAKVSKMTKKEMDELKAKQVEQTKKLAAAMDKPVGSKEVQDLIAEHYKGIQFFYDCPIEMYRNMGKMYIADPRFTKYYDKHRPGLALFVRDAIDYFCDHHK
jgi:DNA-binding transcriptional MerR regulator